MACEPVQERYNRYASLFAEYFLPFLPFLVVCLASPLFTSTLSLMMLYLPALTFSPKLLLVLLRAALPKSIWALTGLFPCACGMEVPRAPMLPPEAPWFTPRFRLLALGGRLLYYVTRIRAIMRLIVKR